MTDPLASAILTRPVWPRTAVVAEVAQLIGRTFGAATAVTMAGQTIPCVDETTGWVHEPGDVVAIDVVDGTVHVTRSLEDRPSVGVVATVAAGYATVTDDAGDAWWASILPGQTVKVGTQVSILWGGFGGVIMPALVPVAIRASQRTIPSEQTSALPGLIPTGPDPATDVTVPAVETGSLVGGTWQDSGDGDRPTQGSPTGDTGSLGCWLYAGGLDWLAGRTIDTATIQIGRVAGQGIAVAPVFQCHTAQTTADTPTWVGSTLTGPSLLPGEQATITLPASFLAPITAGAAHGIGIVGGDWCACDGVATTVASGLLHITSH